MLYKIIEISNINESFLEVKVGTYFAFAKYFNVRSKIIISLYVVAPGI